MIQASFCIRRSLQAWSIKEFLCYCDLVILCVICLIKQSSPACVSVCRRSCELCARTPSPCVWNLRVSTKICIMGNGNFQVLPFKYHLTVLLHGMGLLRERWFLNRLCSAWLEQSFLLANPQDVRISLVFHGTLYIEMSIRDIRVTGKQSR